VIGALAGAGLRLSGNDGRLKGKIKLKCENDLITVKEIIGQSIVEQVRSLDGEILAVDEFIHLGDWIKAILQGGVIVLPVHKPETGNAGWHTCTKQHSRIRTGRHDQPLGDTFRFWPEIEPLPACKPPMSGEVIELIKPDLEHLLEEDYPFILVDKDIRENLSQYPRLGGKPYPNIDFRRVPNLIVFFRRRGLELTKEVRPGDVDNLNLWQAGDIVTYDYPHEHIAIISNNRRSDGVPYFTP